MQIQAPQNANYAATVVRLRTINKLANCDNVVGTSIHGMQAIVSNDTQVGDLGIVLPAEAQLSEEFCRKNNLFRHSNLNDDESKSGYIEDNRRIRAVKFRGHQSSCLFMPLESLEYTGVPWFDLDEGATFDELNGHEICRKYVVPVKESNKTTVHPEKFVRVEKKHMPEHIDTDNYFRYKQNIGATQRIVVTQKLHGTSIRVGHTLVKRKLNIVERVLESFGIKIKETEFDFVYGSRRVIKDVNNPEQQHYYDADIWTQEGRKLEGAIPENFIVYGELIGWTADGAPIQQDYTYGLPQGTSQLYVYRVAFVNGQGYLVDLTWEQVKEFCNDFGLKHVPELWTGQHRNCDLYRAEKNDSKSKFLNNRYADSHFLNAISLGDDKKLVDEGVCIRVDSLVPYILKAKSSLFLEHETKMLDKEVTDLEAEGSNG